MSEFTGLLIGFILTLFIYSYILGDNPLYRLAVHILVGVSAAYAAVVVARQVILPVYNKIQQDPTSTENLLWFVPIFLALLLLLKRLPAVAWLGNSTLALLVGVGAAVALTGAITGTLWPQVTAVSGQTPLQGLLIALLTVCTLLTFHFSGRPNNEGKWRQPIWQKGLVHIGRGVLMITFGVLFATVFNTSLVLLIDRISFYLTQVSEFLQASP